MAIDRVKIIDNLSKLNVCGDENGLIEGYNVYVNQLPTAFWNGFAERIIKSVGDDFIDAADYLLTNCAQSCGYHTGWGIINSTEWKSVVAPMIEKVPEDVLHGAFAVFTAWGWAKSEVVELIPNEKMVVRAYDYYESDVIKYGKSNIPCAFMIRGVSAAFMDLAYGKPYPDGLGTFECKQVKGIECGHDYGEFIITCV